VGGRGQVHGVELLRGMYTCWPAPCLYSAPAGEKIAQYQASIFSAQVPSSCYSLQARALLAAEPTHNIAEADIAMAFQQSALKSTADTDPLFGAITLRWMPVQQLERPEAEGGAPAWHPSHCTSVAVPGCDAWDGLFIECTVEWPLQLLFPPEASLPAGGP